MDIATPLTKFSGIGYSYFKKLSALNIFTVEDLITHYPFRYDDFSQTEQIADIQTGEKATFKGEIWSIQNVYTRSRKILTKAILNDTSGSVDLVWFNQSWLTKSIKPGDKLQVSGKVNRYKNKITLVSPVWEKITFETEEADKHLHTGRLVPIYPETEGLSSKWLRLKISRLLPQVLPNLEDPLPEEVRGEFMPLSWALSKIHFPDNIEQARLARQRLSFDELFFIQLNNQRQNILWKQKKIARPLKIDPKKLNQFSKALPFKLTKAQKRVMEEIIKDLEKGYPMNRLVQGDVGSGKTVVAAAIAYLVHLNNLRSIIMAPTEILAFQHYKTLTTLLEPYGITVGIYTGSKKFNKIPESKNSHPDILVGTHALLSEKLELQNVGLVVVDEQQRFGVKQRSALRDLAGTPHFLTMTATPIPRTVALTLYGDLDLSVIDELPLGRKEIKTHFVPKKKREDAYKFIADHVQKGEQVYIITPLIEESETLASVKAAKVEFERLKKEVFPKLNLGLLHGKLKSKEKEQVINDFKDHKTDILISTSVVEVGVDVANATIMVIEGAERFGLAQLHQLRGRVGRGSEQSFTFLFTEQELPAIVNRLKNLERIHDGLKLAELDLKIRGAGELFGLKQSGYWDLKIATLSDLELIEST
jgi:ATP-dependent DNA helicase RecG